MLNNKFISLLTILYKMHLCLIICSTIILVAFYQQQKIFINCRMWQLMHCHLRLHTCFRFSINLLLLLFELHICIFCLHLTSNKNFSPVILRDEWRKLLVGVNSWYQILGRQAYHSCFRLQDFR